jgi:hypothetical protein
MAKGGVRHDGEAALHAMSSYLVERMRRWCGWLFFALGFVTASGAGAQETEFASRVNGLLGYWMARQDAESPPRGFGLRVTNVLSVDRNSASLVAYFGDVRRGWDEAKNVRVDLGKDGAGVTLTFSTANGTAVQLERQQDGSYLGEFVSDGKRKLRFEKTTLPVIQGWMADHPSPELRARRNSVIELVNLSAADCPYCLTWERDYIERGKLTKSELWPEIRYTVQKRARLRDPVRPADLPEHLRPAVLEAAKNRGRELTGAPWFVVVVDDRLRASLFGTGSFDSYVGATIRAAIRERASDTAKSAKSAQ